MTSSDRFYRAAMFCGLVPLTIGIGIFILRLVTGWFWWMLAGLLTIYAGVVSVTIGADCLIVFAVKTSGFDRTARIGRPVFIAATALLINFPVAVAIAAAALYLAFRIEITVVN